VVLRVTIALLILGLLAGRSNRPTSIVLNQNEVPADAKNVQLTIKRTNGQPFMTKAESALWVGIALNTKLVKFEPKPDEPRAPRTLTVEIEDLETNWNPPPRAGDTLLVAVYQNKQPITTVCRLSVIPPTRAPISLLVWLLLHEEQQKEWSVSFLR
jgi:hypothetical protein